MLSDELVQVVSLLSGQPMCVSLLHCRCVFLAMSRWHCLCGTVFVSLCHCICLLPLELLLQLISPPALAYYYVNVGLVMVFGSLH